MLKMLLEIEYPVALVPMTVPTVKIKTNVCPRVRDSFIWTPDSSICVMNNFLLLLGNLGLSPELPAVQALAESASDVELPITNVDPDVDEVDEEEVPSEEIETMPLLRFPVVVTPVEYLNQFFTRENGSRR